MGKKTVIIIGVAFVLVLVVVAVLSGVLSANREKDKCNERVSQAKQECLKSEDTSTTAESKTTTEPKSTKTMRMTTTEAPTTPSKQKSAWEEIRLPTNLHPLHYDMLVRTYLNKLTFTGNSNITIKVTNSTDLILFHINLLEIRAVSVEDGSGKPLAIKEEFGYKPNQFYVVRMDAELPVGRYTLKIKFAGNVTTKQLNGFYNSTYTTKGNITRVLGATDFQPTDARKAFPCFDEPALKATFTISIEHASEYRALSNMPAVSRRNVSNSRTVTQFQKSVRMPTYLVAYIVSDFQSLNTTTGTYDNITLRTWSTPDQYTDSQYGLNIGKNVTTFLEKYYNIPFPLPKQDMVALPDFNSGAMENWGIITYRETALLYKPGVSSETNRQRIAYVVAHELAHMWFGNLVSCKWWNDIWLNEGFASFVEYLATDHAEPDWDFLGQFLLNDLQRAFRADSVTKSHPIRVDVEHPDNITTLFDTITYSKGSSIIRMLSSFLGEETFRKGLTYYLNKYRFGNAETKDLWAALSETVGDDVGKIMETWTNQMGFPVVNVYRNGSNQGLATQKHFLFDPNGNVTEESPFQYTWYIPFTYILKGSPQNVKNDWMNRTSVTFDWPDNEWIKVNYKQYGFYRVNYEKENWDELSKVLKTNRETLTSSDRASLIDDAFNLAKANQLHYEVPFNLSEYIVNETKYVPWGTFLSNIDSLNTLLNNQDSYGLFQKYVLGTLEKQINVVGWKKSKNDKHLDIYMRTLILGAACSYGHQVSNEKVKNLFIGYLRNNETLDVDLKTVIYYYGIANTGYEEWDELFKKYQSTTVASEKSKLLYGLSGSSEPWLLRRLLRYSLDSTKIRSQDTVTVVNYVARSPIGREFAWKFVKENWATFYTRYAKLSFRLAYLIKVTTATMNSEVDLNDVKEFLENRDTGSAARASVQVVEQIQSNIDWIKRSAGEINEYLTSK